MTPLFARYGRDAVAVLGLSWLAFSAGSGAFAASPPQAFSQSEFGPAVMIAAGHGFVNPEPVPGGQAASVPDHAG